jgi:DNA-binding Lrp family transcriptional regulator
MTDHKIDSIDRQILAELQEDGRMTNVELAERVGISPPPCLRRVRNLEDKGYIKGFNAAVDQELLGFGVTVFANVGLVSQAEADLVAFENLMRSLPEVRECHMLSGEIDFLLKIVAPNMDAFQRFLTGQLTCAPNVSQVKTSLTVRASFRKPGVPIAAA